MSSDRFNAAPLDEWPLRERNKFKRRRAILDATRVFLRANPLGEMTVEKIAAQAEVSPATVYNLIGAREQLLMALLDSVFDDLFAALADLDRSGSADPVGAARLIVDASVAAFTADSAVYRQVLLAFSHLTASAIPATLDPAQLQVAAMRDAQAAGVVRGEVNPTALGRQIYLSYLGALHQWADGSLDDHGFAVAARHGLVMVLAAASTDDHRAGFLHELVELGAADWQRHPADDGPTRG